MSVKYAPISRAWSPRKASAPTRAAAFATRWAGTEWLGGASSLDQTLNSPAPGSAPITRQFSVYFRNFSRSRFFFSAGLSR